MKKIHRTIVAALLVTKDEKLFLGWQREGGAYDDCWHIPGGGVDEEENLESALRREVLEETGIDISHSELELIDYKGTGVATKIKNGEQIQVSMEFNVFRVDLDDNSTDIEVSLDDDLVKYEWVDLEKLDQYLHTPPSVELFTRLGWI